MLEALTGLGLATSAGLNAYIPLLAIGLMARYTDLITLPASWSWLENGWVILVLVILLAIETVADKIPLVDHANDVIQTVVRPTAGGLAFGAASSSQTVTVSNPAEFFSSHQWVPIVSGMVISFIIHSMKAAARPVINATTVGVGAPVASTAEDIVSVLLSFAAIIFPVLVIIFLVAIIWAFVALRRRRKRRKAEKLARKDAERAARQAVHDGHTLDLWR